MPSRPKAIPARNRTPVQQFSVFTENRVGRLHDLTSLLTSNGTCVLALTIVDSTDSAIVRLVVNDPDDAATLLTKAGFAFVRNPLVVVALDSATDLGKPICALLEAELHIHYLYSFIPHPNGRSLIALSLEDPEMAEEILTRHQIRVLRQADLVR